MSDFSIENDVPVLPTDEPQDAIDRPGSSIDLLWRPGVPRAVPPDFDGWAAEQEALTTDVVLLDVSHHMNDLYLSYTKDRVELVGELVGLSEYAASAAIKAAVHSIARVDIGHAQPGTVLDLKWGQHPVRSNPDFSNFDTIRVTVQPAPYNAYARSAYRGAFV